MRPEQDLIAPCHWAEPSCSGPPKEPQEERAGSPIGGAHLSGLPSPTRAPGQKHGKGSGEPCWRTAAPLGDPCPPACSDGPCGPPGVRLGHRGARDHRRRGLPEKLRRGGKRAFVLVASPGELNRERDQGLEGNLVEENWEGRGSGGDEFGGEPTAVASARDEEDDPVWAIRYPGRFLGGGRRDGGGRGRLWWPFIAGRRQFRAFPTK